MKLAVCSLGDPLLPRTWSGTPANLCRSLAATGHLGETLDTESYLPAWQRVGVKIASKLFYTGSRYVRLGRAERALRARHAHAKLGPGGSNATDILHICTHDAPPFLSPTTSGQPRQRHYLLIDGTWRLWRLHTTDGATISSRLSRDIEKLDHAAYHAVDHIFTISEYVGQDLISNYGVPDAKITVVGSGRGSIQPYHGPKDYADGPILFVAKERFCDKGGERLVAGFALARLRNPSLRLVIAGREEYPARFADLPGVTAYGHVSLARLQTLFEEASLFAMPAVNEPWGLVYLEALSCKVPVLGLRRLSLPEITRDGRHGFCLDSGSAEEIADTLCRAFDDPGVLAEMGTSGQAYCLNTFTWERAAQLIVDKATQLAATGT